MMKNGQLNRETTAVFNKSTSLPHFILKHEGRFQTLTPREIQVLTFIAKGWTPHAVARELAVKTKTVRNYNSSIRRKLGIKHKTDYLQYALAFGLISF